MGRPRKSEGLRRCRLCRGITVNARHPKILVQAPFFRRLDGSNSSTELRMSTYTDGFGDKEVWDEPVQLGRIYVESICSYCRIKIATEIDIPASEVMSQLADLSEVAIDARAAEHISRFTVKTLLLMNVAEPTFFSPALAAELRTVMRTKVPLARNISVGIARTTGRESKGLQFRQIGKNEARCTFGTLSVHNLALYGCIPQNTEVSIESIVPSSHPYWRFQSAFTPLWPSRSFTLQWPLPDAIGIADINEAYEKVRTSKPGTDPIIEALRRAGLR